MNDGPPPNHGGDSSVDRYRLARGQIDARIRRAAGVSAGDHGVTVVAVSKTRTAEEVVAAFHAGFAHFGENYAAEFAAKAEAVNAQLAASTEVPAAGRSTIEVAAPTWHFIGQLQTNKVRVVAPATDVYQSVDRVSLLAALARRVPGAAVMIQVDLSGIAGRGGVPADEAPALIEQARSAALDVVGVMGVAPVAGESTVAEAFTALRALRDREGVTHCSMGMSGDFELAVRHGSTMVRLGTAVFGRRGEL